MTLVKQPSLYANPKLPNTNGWQDQHNEAINEAITDPRRAFETPIVHMLKGWAKYAAQHYARYQSPIGSDYVLGPAWRNIGLGIRALLNGECGRLDCGTLDAFIVDTLHANGMDDE